ncbi:MAG: arginase family protein [Nitrososphaeraceae archaeon]|nr:arginase family protein [Nitrososphaeraceae archaeon]MDW0154511.1 arginase family protein [Nitrososphaeraceae archaeon]MDW0156560.1 arginase family protein [Nitrososphaeraceae archaeon]
MKLLHSNAESIFKADIVVMGVPDESKSHAKRKGASKGPDSLRTASNTFEFFERDGKTIPICPMKGTLENKKILDFGNITRDDLYRLIFDIVTAKKIPITIGGDHSITTIILQAVNEALDGDKVSLIYFDAHPDFVSSTRNYYGSVITDSSNYIDFKKSVLIGTRAAEQEELLNASKRGLEIVTPLDILEVGINHVVKKIISKCKSNKVYLSIDLDCMDPGVAPGVSVPAPGGLFPLDLIYMIKKITENLQVVGMDIVELSPDYDINQNTANHAARILMETISSMDISFGRTT